MDYVGILANVILYTTVGTLIAAIAAYTAYKMRDKRKPNRKAAGPVKTAEDEFVFLKRYVPDQRAAAPVAPVAGKPAASLPTGSPTSLPTGLPK